VRRDHSSLKGIEVKMQVLVVVVMAALASPATWAASEGGDTWSAVEQVQRSPYSVLQAAPRGEPAAAMGAAWVGSEGGDTSSHLQALHEKTVQQAGNQARTARTDAMAADQTGSEGGDTWSRFVPQPAALRTSTAGVASEPAL
jgi:hypothetical protein